MVVVPRGVMLKWSQIRRVDVTASSQLVPSMSCDCRFSATELEIHHPRSKIQGWVELELFGQSQLQFVIT